MYRLIIMLFPLFLAACDADSLRVQSVEEWDRPAADTEVTVATFREISAAIGQEARSQCLRRDSGANCDIRILVDLNPLAPANAFQTLDEDGQPVIIFTRKMIQSVQNADELAFVMGHEAAHHVLGHIPRQRQNAKQSAATFGERARLRGGSEAEIEEARELGAKVGVQAYLKDFELEADQLGTIITYHAGYNPLIGARYFARIPDPGDNFLGSHPPNAQRVQIVQETARTLGVPQ